MAAANEWWAKRFVDEGAMLKISDSIVSILKTDILTGVISVTEKKYPQLHVGQAVKISTDAYPEESFPGKVLRIAPLAHGNFARSAGGNRNFQS